MSLSNTLDERDSKIYIGTRTNLIMLTNLPGDEPAWGMIGLIDLPISLVMDTVFLPYTIPHDLLDNSNDKDTERDN